MLNKTYNIKKGYKIRAKNAPFPDIQPTGTIYQPFVYEMAIFLAERGNKKYIVDIGAGSGEKLIEASKRFEVIAVDCDTNIELLKKNLPNSRVINHDLEKGLPNIDEEILKEAVVISVDVIEHIVEPHKYLKDLSKISKVAPYLLISTPDRTRARGAEDYGPPSNPFHVREWAIDELNGLLSDYSIEHSIGFTVSNDDDEYKGTVLAISGREATYKLSPQLRVIAIMTAYNEEDIVDQSIEHLLSQGVDVHVIDNWSTDNTFAIIKKIAKSNPRVSYERFPQKKPVKHRYEWERLLKRVEAIAVKASHDWVIHNDADELRLSPWENATLVQAISFVDSLGYDAIDFTVADFRPTKEGFEGGVNPDAFFYNFEFTGIGGYFQQIKCWKNNEKLDLASSGGHHANFPAQKLFPLKFFSKHYPLRSSGQANKKIFKERKKDFDPAEREKGWHTHYDSYEEQSTFLWDATELNKFTYGNFYNDYIVERLSGVGIKRTSPEDVK